MKARLGSDLHNRRGDSYSVIKFVPDEVRFEPINVGLVVQAGERLITKMAEDVDPRIRLADPYVDLLSLRNTLRSLDVAAVAEEARVPSATALEWLSARGLPNLYFTAPAELDLSADSTAEVAVGLLFRRLVERAYERPPHAPQRLGTTATRTALRRAFAAANVLHSRVQPSARVVGASGEEWIIDFRYLTDSVNLIQTATTDLKDRVRSEEHAYEAFAALIDTTKDPGTAGLVAVDEKPEANRVSGRLAHLADAHGFELIAGQRAFMELAREVRQRAHQASSSAQLVEGGLFPAE